MSTTTTERSGHSRRHRSAGMQSCFPLYLCIFVTSSASEKTLILRPPSCIVDAAASQTVTVEYAYQVLRITQKEWRSWCVSLLVLHVAMEFIVSDSVKSPISWLTVASIITYHGVSKVKINSTKREKPYVIRTTSSKILNDCFCYCELLGSASDAMLQSL